MLSGGDGVCNVVQVAGRVGAKLCPIGPFLPCPPTLPFWGLQNCFELLDVSITSCSQTTFIEGALGFGIMKFSKLLSLQESSGVFTRWSESGSFRWDLPTRVFAQAHLDDSYDHESETHGFNKYESRKCDHLD
jgi:hypothetical protein